MSKKSNKVICAVMAASLTLSATAAFAYRPLISEDAQSLAKGKAQIDVVGDYAKAKNGGAKSYGLLFVPSFGVADKLEVAAEIPLQYLDGNGTEHGGFGDLNLTAKYELLKGTDLIPDVAVKGNLKTYTGNENLGLGNGTLEGGISAIASKSFGKLGVNSSVGYTFAEGNSDVNDFLTYSASVDYQVNPQIDAVATVSGKQFVNADISTANETAVLVGASYKLNKDLSLNAGYKQGLTNATPDYGVTLGATYSF